jgi:hypothetical protein
MMKKIVLPNFLGNFCTIKKTNKLTSTSPLIDYLGQERASVATFPPLHMFPRRETYAPELHVSSKRM